MNPNRKHGLLLFLSACIPGCGQMHLGYMNRGLSLLLAASSLFAVAMLLNIGALLALLPMIWLYSFYDTYNLRSRMDAGQAPPDQMLFGLSDLDSVRLSSLCRKRHSLVGWVLVCLGGWALYSLVADWVFDLLSPYFDLWWLRRLLTFDVPRLALTVGIILLGLWFIRGPRSAGGEEIPSFVPPEAPDPAASEKEEGHGTT